MTVISTENIGKRYRLPEKHQEQYETFRGMLTSSAREAWQHLTGHVPQKREDFWALRNLSFTVKEGERLGIVGRNGAGKSTLLKLLSRITEPTEGRITLKGRVGSLLEVGTGFHPELTGRENIYLNGAILGMSHNEIRRKFDEIVNFAEVEKFLDMPVKRYSSGMYVRLAFAVAAHLEPDVLIIDEVLAVGDSQFQKKCLGKMEDIAGHGRTILFVSHNMNAVQQLCNRVIWLEKGRLVEDSNDPIGLSHRYLFNANEETASVYIKDTNLNGFLDVRAIFVGNENGEAYGNVISADAPLYVYIETQIDDPQPDLNVGYALRAENGEVLYWSCATDRDPQYWPSLEKGKCILRTQIPSHLLNEGLFRIEVMVSLQFKRWLYAPNELSAVTFRIQGGLSTSPYWISRRDGVLAPHFPWERVV